MTVIHAKTDLQITAFGQDLMRLYVADTGDLVVNCTRNGDGSWTVSADGVDDVTVPADLQPGPTFRAGAIDAMCDMALAALPNDGYSVLVPHGLVETP